MSSKYKNNKILQEYKYKDKVANEVLNNKFVTTVNNGVINILDVPFKGAEQELTMSNLSQVIPSLKKGFLLLKKGATKYSFKNIKEHDEVLRTLPMNTPTLFIDINTYRDMMYTVKRSISITGNECGGFFLYRKLLPTKPIYIASSQFIVGQEANSGSVELDSVDIAKYIEYYTEKYTDSFKNTLESVGFNYTGNLWDYLGHWHSHGNMGTFWSSTDRAQQESKEQLGFNASERFYLVFNVKGEVKASYVQYNPLFYRVDDINVGLYIGSDYNFSAEEQTKLDNIIESVIVKYSPTFKYNLGAKI